MNYAARDARGYNLRVGDPVRVAHKVRAARLTMHGIEDDDLPVDLVGIVVALRPHSDGHQVDVAFGSKVCYLGAHHLERQR